MQAKQELCYLNDEGSAQCHQLKPNRLQKSSRHARYIIEAGAPCPYISTPNFLKLMTLGSACAERFSNSIRYGEQGKETYPSGYAISNVYDAFGYLTKVNDPEGNTLWQAKESNARGQLTKTESAGRETKFNFDSRGFPQRTTTPGIAMEYQFDTRGNLTLRRDVVLGQEEVFHYDLLNRLDSWNTNGITNRMRYTATPGGIAISEKSDAGYEMCYGENGFSPHALTSYLPFPNTSSNAYPQNIEYSDFKKVKHIEEGENQLFISYGVDEQRIRSIQAGSRTLARYYISNYEEEYSNGNIRKIHYICGGNGLAAIYIQNASGENAMYYAHTDYQGSLIALSSVNGSIVQRYAYDPWGNRRNPENWTQPDNRPATALIMYRGYTLHEHLPEFKLINMNGRMYDPVTAQFLSPDPYLQAPGDWLNYNRYSYCLNNPFKYTDPSGENPLLIAAIIIGAYLGGSSVNGTFNPVKWDYNNWQTYAGIAVGGVAGWAGAAVGVGIAAPAVAGGSSSIGAGIAGGMVGGMISGGINGAGMTAVMGGSFDDVMANMTKGMVIGGFSGALSGGVGAAIGDFSGVAGGAFKNGIYELGHSALKGAATGLAGGAMMAAMEQDASYLWKGAALGAALSVGMAGIRITALGTTFIPDSKYGTFEDFGQVYRRGSIFMSKGSGITLGRNVAVRLTGNLDYDRYLMQHETGHLSQINDMGMAKFYGRTAKEYLQYGLRNVYCTPGTLEYGAEYYAFQRLGYYYGCYGRSITFP